MRKIGWILMLVALVGCGERKFPRPDFESIDFGTTAQAKLFFKNVRSYYYETDLYGFEGAEVYRWAGRDTDSAHYWLHPVLVIHLLQDQVFLLTESSAAVQRDCKPWLYRYAPGRLDSISLQPNSMQEHLNLNVFVYDAIDDSLSLCFETLSGERLPYLASKKAKADHHKQVRDFLRLAGKI
jgi:hypothetical protein